MQTKRVPFFTGLAVVLFAQVLWASSAELRYIRIGEHRDHTRLVFEFSQLPVFQDPVVSAEETVLISFADTSTVLPRKIPAETTDRVEFLEFLADDGDLTAQIRLSFLNPELSIFPLTDPPRIVVDIHAAPLETGSASKEAADTTGKTEEPPAKKVGRNPAGKTSVQPDPIPKGTAAAAPAGEPSAKREEAEDVLLSQEAGLSAPANPQHNQEPERSVSPAEMAGNVHEHLPLQGVGEKSDLEVYLLTALTVLSVAIVGLLFTLVRRKGNLPTTCPNGVLESDGVNGQRIDEIDHKIEDALRKMAPS